MENIISALEISKKDLRSCYGESGIFAGLHHFKDYWARDSFFASFGALAAKDNDIVKKNLVLHMKNCGKNGQIPLRVGTSSFGIFLSYMRLPRLKRKAIYCTDKNSHPSVDQNSLFIIALHQYVKSTRDYALLRENFSRIEKIMQWNMLNDTDNDYLIEEHEYCNWADSVRKRGKVLYTNVCHCHALSCIKELSELVGKHTKSRYFGDLHKETKKKINESFWSGEHYIDWLEGDKIHNYFCADGNLLAVIWDVCDEIKARRIEECLHIFDMDRVPSPAAHPSYSSKYISNMIRFIGLEDYHTSLSWLWLGAINALSKHKLGLDREAKAIITRMAEMIVRSNGTYEIYEDNGTPVRRIFYRSEHPFAWGAGMFIYAATKIYNIKS